MGFAAGEAQVGHSVGAGDCEMVWAEPGQVQGTAVLVYHWVTPTAEELHPAKANRQLRTSQTILWDRFSCLQEPQITKWPHRTLTLYFFKWVWVWRALCPNTSQFFFNSLWQTLKIKATMGLCKTKCCPEQPWLLQTAWQEELLTQQTEWGMRGKAKGLQTLSGVAPVPRACGSDAWSVTHDQLIRTWSCWEKPPPPHGICSCHCWIRGDTSMHFKKCIF